MTRRPVRLISESVMLVPRPLRRWLADRPLVQALLNRVAGGRRVVRETPGGTKIVMNPVLHAPLAKLPQLDQYEPEMWTVLGSLCRKQSVAYDIGANVGVFTCRMAELVGPQGSVVAFEPEPHNCECLRETIRLNGLDHVRLEPIAVGETNGVAVFDRRGGAFSGRLRDHGRYHVTRNLLEVQVQSLDGYIYQQGHAPPRIVKIDVEGNELLVLRGMQEVMRRQGPTIICELHPHLGDSLSDVFRLLEEHSYGCFEPMSVASGQPKRTHASGQREWIVALKQPEQASTA